MELLLQAMRAYAPVSEEEVRHLYAFFKEQQYKRNTLLLDRGQVAHELFFVKKGALRQYFYDEKGNERTCNFIFEGEFLTDLESFSHQSPSSTHIRSIEPVECLVITCKDLARCMSESQAIAKCFNRVVEKVAAANIRRIQSLLSTPSEQQYEELIQHKPGVLQRIPQRYIAQYLGIAPESLSRIRKRMLNSEKS